MPLLLLLLLLFFFSKFVLSDRKPTQRWIYRHLLYWLECEAGLHIHLFRLHVSRPVILPTVRECEFITICDTKNFPYQLNPTIIQISPLFQPLSAPKPVYQPGRMGYSAVKSHTYKYLVDGGNLLFERQFACHSDRQTVRLLLSPAVPK